MRTKPLELPTKKQQWLLDHVVVRPARKDEIDRCHRALDKHHYLGSIKPVGERLYYVATTPTGGHLGVMLFCAAANHLKARETWVGWNEEQRRARLPLAVNNTRFLILPHKAFANLGTRMMRLALDRLSTDWTATYGHPVLIVETFVDPQFHDGVVYRAGGWTELGQTKGWGRHVKEYYLKHNRPKRLFVRELQRNARRSLTAERLRPELAMVEVGRQPRCTLPLPQVRSLAEHFMQTKDHRTRIGRYPIWCLLTIVALAALCGSATGQKDIVRFARKFSGYQRRALRIHKDRSGNYPTPSQSTFSRLLARVDGRCVEEAILRFQEQLRGPPSSDGVVALDGKEARGSGGHQILTAIDAKTQHYLGSLPVDEKTNEIPVARELFNRLDLSGRLVGLDALHTQTETARVLVLEHGADYLLTVKGNQEGLEKRLQALLPVDEAGFSPSPHDDDPHVDEGNKQRAPRVPGLGVDACDRRTDMLPLRRTSGSDRPEARLSQAGDSLAGLQPTCGTFAGGFVVKVQTGILGH